MVHRLERYLLFNLCDLAAGLCPIHYYRERKFVQDNLYCRERESNFSTWHV